MYILRLKYSSNYAITTDNQSVTPSTLIIIDASFDYLTNEEAKGLISK